METLDQRYFNLLGSLMYLNYYFLLEKNGVSHLGEITFYGSYFKHIPAFAEDCKEIPYDKIVNIRVDASTATIVIKD